MYLYIYAYTYTIVTTFIILFMIYLDRYFHLFILMHIFRVNRADTVRWSMSQMDTGG